MINDMREEWQKKTFTKTPKNNVRVMTDKGGGSSRNRSVPQRQRSVQTHLVDDTRKFTRHLHSRFDRIDGHEDDPEQTGRDTTGDGFNAHVHILGTFE
jgi:hypothetical protein